GGGAIKANALYLDSAGNADLSNTDNNFQYLKQFNSAGDVNLYSDLLHQDVAFNSAGANVTIGGTNYFLGDGSHAYGMDAKDIVINSANADLNGTINARSVSLTGNGTRNINMFL